MSLYNKMQINASAIGKRFTHKSASRISSTQEGLLNNSIVKHHPLFTRQSSGIRDEDKPLQLSKQAESLATNKIAAEFTDRSNALPQDQSKHSKLIRSIIAPDNPFARMTEKDMLIFNPNYQAFLEKLKSKESKTSELNRIMAQPYDAKAKSRKKKKELALYAFMRTQQKHTSASLDPSLKAGGNKISGMLQHSQSNIAGSISRTN